MVPTSLWVNRPKNDFIPLGFCLYLQVGTSGSTLLLSLFGLVSNQFLSETVYFPSLTTSSSSPFFLSFLFFSPLVVTRLTLL